MLLRPDRVRRLSARLRVVLAAPASLAHGASSFTKWAAESVRSEGAAIAVPRTNAVVNRTVAMSFVKVSVFLITDGRADRLV
ncbi:hypothetical protein JCM13580A_01670 [Streptomyces drozdowiczii]